MPLSIKFLLFGILILGTILRFNVLQQSPLDPDVNRDIVISTHLAKYKELPVDGPPIGYFSGLNNSSFYYYFLASLMLSMGNYHLLFYINLILQVSSILFVYLLVKEIFGERVAFLSMIFMATAKIFVAESMFPYQPYLMTPFLIFSMWFLVKSYKTLNLKWYIPCLLLFTFSALVHMSAFIISPIYLIPGYLIYSKHKNIFRKPLYIFITTTLIASVWFVNFDSSSNFLINRITRSGFNLRVQNYEDFYININLVLAQFFSVLFNTKLSSNLNIVLLVFTSLGIVNSSDIKKKFFLIILTQVIVFLLFFVFISGADPNPYEIHRFYPGYILGVVLVSYVVNIFFRKLKKGALFEILVLLCLTNVFNNNLSFYGYFYKDMSEPLSGVIKTLESKINNLGYAESGMRSFQLKVYECRDLPCDWRMYPYADTAFWNPLELYYNMNFVKVTPGGYENITSDKYLYLVCYNNNNVAFVEGQCLKTFLNDYSDYTFVEKISDNQAFHLYLAQKQ